MKGSGSGNACGEFEDDGLANAVASPVLGRDGAGGGLKFDLSLCVFREIWNAEGR